MAALPLKAQVVREALRGIGQAIEGLSRPTGSHAAYVLDGNESGRAGLPPRLCPEIVEVTEALMGAAFVIAQEHVGNAATAQLHLDIEHVANYWRHRVDWGGQWQSAHRRTLAGIKSLSGGNLPVRSPVEVGLLTELAEKALKQPFSPQALWDAIADVP
jgi:hypothetical protein